MENERLQATVKQLHDELARAEGVDPETLARLRTLTTEIELALDKGEKSRFEAQSRAKGLKDLLLEYEAEHPQLAVSVGRVADALAAMGF
jgi:hypothetical protein